MRDYVYLFVIGLLLPSCCTTRAPNAATLHAVDMAWQAAEASCMQTQRLIVEREYAGLAKPAETDALLTSTRAKCDAVTAAFEELRGSM